jgi:mRNA-degrading endonuclease YafQ of YafQ-DinJ toxin-antitoxin module
MKDCIPQQAFIDSLLADPEKFKKFIRSVTGAPTRTLEGNEKNNVILLLALMQPYETSNNQHSWTEYYMIGNTEYHVTTFPDSEVVVEEILDETD